MRRYFIIYKPYQVLSQFTPADGKKCLKDYFKVDRDIYPVGRLDYDSEGLLILTNDKTLNHRLLQPEYAHEREYWVQVEGSIAGYALEQVQEGVEINISGKMMCTRPARAIIFGSPPAVPERNPPVRFRKNIPSSWISIILTEGKNRQVRKMLAKTGFPVIRLIRCRIGNLRLDDMKPGEMKEISHEIIYDQLFGK
jgi:23S rRNA pseudouridine2457 synthase